MYNGTDKLEDRLAYSVGGTLKPVARRGPAPGKPVGLITVLVARSPRTPEGLLAMSRTLGVATMEVHWSGTEGVGGTRECRG